MKQHIILGDRRIKQGNQDIACFAEQDEEQANRTAMRLLRAILGEELMLGRYVLHHNEGPLMCALLRGFDKTSKETPANQVYFLTEKATFEDLYSEFISHKDETQFYIHIEEAHMGRGANVYGLLRNYIKASKQ